MTAMLQVSGLGGGYRIRNGMFGAVRDIVAVEGVSFSVDRNEVLGIVGESGCGKSSLAKMLLGLKQPSAGVVSLEGKPLSGIRRRDRARLVQAVFQDPLGSLNPRRTVASIIGMPLEAAGIGTSKDREARVAEVMGLCGLPQRFAARRPNQLSGGQRQRVAIARALVTSPQLVVCDEPTSALDVSVQAQILNLLQEIRERLGLTLVFISHNLAVVEFLATKVAVMYLGRIVEYGPAAEIFSNPRHPYTRALLESTLEAVPGKQTLPVLPGRFASVFDRPSGCAFHPRCPAAQDTCASQRPQHVEIGKVLVECHLHGPQSAKISSPQTIETT